MNSKKRKFYLAIPVLLVSLTAYAHEPDEHVNEAQQLDCSSMVDIDQSKTDANDPILQAMLMKCKDQLASGDLHASHEHDGDNSIGHAHTAMDRDHGTAVVASDAPENGHEHGGDVVVGDAHAHVESGHDVSTAAVVGAIVEHSHSDTHEEEDHGDHH